MNRSLAIYSLFGLLLYLTFILFVENAAAMFLSITHPMTFILPRVMP